MKRLAWRHAWPHLIIVVNSSTGTGTITGKNTCFSRNGNCPCVLDPTATASEYQEISISRIYRRMKNERLAESLRPLDVNRTFASSLKWTEVIDRNGEFQVRSLRSYFQFSRLMLRSPNEASWLISKWPVLTMLRAPLTFFERDGGHISFVIYRREISSKRFFHPWLSNRVVHW